MYLPEHLVHQLDQGGPLHQFDPEKIDEKTYILAFNYNKDQFRDRQT